MGRLDLEHPDITRYNRNGYLTVPECIRECPGCENDIEPGAHVFTIEDTEVCRECFEEWVKDYLSTNPVEVAKALKVDSRVAS